MRVTLCGLCVILQKADCKSIGAESLFTLTFGVGRWEGVSDSCMVFDCFGRRVTSPEPPQPKHFWTLSFWAGLP